MRRDKDMVVVAASALLCLSTLGVVYCPTARAGAAPAVATKAAPVPPASKDSGEDNLDDDRAEHWAVPSIAREGRVQSVALVIGLLGAGAYGARRRSILKGQRRAE